MRNIQSLARAGPYPVRTVSSRCRQVDWNDAIGSLGNEGLQHHPARTPRGAVDEIDCLVAFRKCRIFPAAGEIEAKSRSWLPRRLHLCAFHMRVEVQIDGGTIDDL